MQIEKIVLGALESNCYIVTDETSGDIAVIDPGFAQNSLIQKIEPVKDRVKLILITHRHFDHLSGAAAVKELTGAKIAIHAMEQEGLFSTAVSLAAHAGEHVAKKQTSVKADMILSGGDVVSLGELRFKVIHTPGHTSGGVCFLAGDVIFSGDTLFYESMGRYDFPTGSFEALTASLKKLFDLPGDYKILPGHYEATTMEHERRYNPIHDMVSLYDE